MRDKVKKEQNYNDKYQAFYNSKEWKSLRAYKFADAGGLCEKCLQKNIIKAGKEVHHIKPIEKFWEFRLVFENLILLCNDCHNEEHGRESELQKFLKMWEEL